MTLGAGVERELRFVATPARRMVTVEMTWDGGWRLPGGKLTLDTIRDAEIRLRVTLGEEHPGTCPLAETQARLLNGGAHAVKVERQVIPKTRGRVAEALSARRERAGGRTASALLEEARNT